MPRVSSWIGAFFRVVGLVLLLALALPAGVLAWWLRDLPPLQALEDLQPATGTVVLDRHGELLAEFSKENRELTTLRAIPQELVLAVLATEDWKFYEHIGIDVQGLARAFLTNLRRGRMQQGGSTITQQLTKVLLLSSERSLRRKVLEVVLALEIERTYSKDQILELYLNTIYFGQGAYGVKTAAEVYFGKDPMELNLPECALLAGLIRAPSQIDPVTNPAKARARRALVLGRMLDRGVIDAAQYEEALVAPLGLQTRPTPETLALDFTEAVRRELVTTIGAERLYAGGLRVETTLDPEVQRISEQALARGLKSVESRVGAAKADDPNGPLQGAVLVMDLETGDVLAMVGGRERAGDAHRFNRALQAHRQPGSLFKPLIYTAAIDNGMTGATLIEDLPVEQIDQRGEVTWAPQNYDEINHGPTTIRTALVHSRNVVAVRVFNTLGLDVVLSYARRMGVTSKLPLYVSLALGAGEVTLSEMITAFSCFGTNGLRVDPRTIRLVTDRRGGLVLQEPPVRRRVLSETTAYILADMLRDAVDRGTGASAAVEGLWVAGKTGTTNDSSDAWFIGTAPPLVIGVWVGYDGRRKIGRETGGHAAAPIFHEILLKLKDRYPFASPAKPDVLTAATIDATTGLVATPRCTKVERELFLPGQMPGPCFH